MIKKFFYQLLIIQCFFLYDITAQELQYVNYKNKYPSEELVILEDEMIVDIKLMGRVLDIEERYVEKRLYLTENATRFNEGNVYYNSFESVTSIKAKTNYLNRFQQYETRKVPEFETKDVLLNGIFFGDLKSKTFVYPAVGIGSITELKHTKKVHEPRFLNSFSFNSKLRTIDARISITASENIKIGYKIFGPLKDSVKYVKEIIEGKRERNRIGTEKVVHTWFTKDLKKIPTESYAPNNAFNRTHIIPFIEYYVTNYGDTIKVAQTIDDLYSWYSGLVNQINEKNDEGLIQLVNDLKSKSSNQIELLQYIYDWVQQNINYIAFEDGYGGFIPRSSDLVFKRKFGDCKDMANLLKKMLEIAGFKEVYLTWIGTRDRPYTYEELHTPMVDNHMITVVKNENEIFYLDATNANAPFGYPSSFIQGKQALVGINDSMFELFNVPIIPKDQNLRSDSLYFQIKGDTLLGYNNRFLNGYQREEIFDVYERISPSDQEKFFNNYLSKGSNAFELLDMESLPVEEIGSNQTSFSYAFQIPRYVRKIRNKLYINPFLNKRYVHQFKDFDNRELAFEYDYKFADKETIVIEIPHGYEIDYIPENTLLLKDEYGYKIDYSHSENLITINYEVFQDFLILQPDNIPAFKSYINELEDDLKATLSLKPILN